MLVFNHVFDVAKIIYDEMHVIIIIITCINII